MLPFLGPSSVRDVVGRVGDGFTDPTYYLQEDAVRLGLVGVRVVDQRADLLTAGDILDDAAIDPYSFLRDVYLQRRQSLVHDGNPPQQGGEDDLWKDVDFGSGAAPGADGKRR